MADLAAQAAGLVGRWWWTATTMVCAGLAAVAARHLAEMAAEMEASHRGDAAKTYRLTYAVVIGLALVCVRLAW